MQCYSTFKDCLWTISVSLYKVDIRYKGQDCFSSFLSMQHTNRCQMTAVALYACPEAITVTWHPLVQCNARSVNSYISFAPYVFKMVLSTSPFSVKHYWSKIAEADKMWQSWYCWKIYCCITFFTCSCSSLKT